MHDVLEVPTDKDIHLADACEGDVKGIVLIIRGEYAPANVFSGQFECFRRQFDPFVRNRKKFFIVVSLDFIKCERRRAEFLRACPVLVIVDEEHTSVTGNEEAFHSLLGLLDMARFELPVERGVRASELPPVERGGSLKMFSRKEYSE